MKKKKNKKVVCGDKVILSIDGEKIASCEPIWYSDKSWTAEMNVASMPTLTNEEYYKYLDMLYEAWKALNKAGYKVKVEME